MKTTKDAEIGSLITNDGAAFFWGVNERTIKRWRAKGICPSDFDAVEQYVLGSPYHLVPQAVWDTIRSFEGHAGFGRPSFERCYPGAPFETSRRICMVAYTVRPRDQWLKMAGRVPDEAWLEANRHRLKHAG